MNAQIVTVNLIPDLSSPAVVKVSQYDVGRPLVFRVMDGMSMATLPQYWYAKVEGTKPSGLGFSETCTISGSTVTVSTTEAMTQECGHIMTEISFTHTGVVIGTANFILAVEPSPHPDGTTDGTQETMANLETRLQAEIDDLDSRIDAIEGDQSIIDDIDALDARVTALEQGGSGLTQAEKNLILTLFSKAAYADSDASTAYDALESMWTTTTRTITYNLSNVVSSNEITSIESGQRYTTELGVRNGYTLNTVSVTMGGVDVTASTYSSGTITIPNVTGNIVITATAVLAATSITATYTQSGTVYDTATLDSLKADLVVTANYAGGTSETVPSSDYTLSGTLTEGTSTITVTYAGLTDTFSVTVTSSRPSNPYITDNMTLWLDGIFNTATGHDASATTWTNLIDNTQLTNVGITVGSDGMVFDGTAGHGFIIGDTPSSPSTIEVVLEVTNPATTQVILGAFGNDNNGNVNVKSSNLLHRRGSSNGGGHTLSTGLHTHTFVVGTAEYVDGVAVSTSSTTISMTVTGAFVIGNALNSAGTGLTSGSGAYPLNGTIKCIRFYSDALTAQEVASNFAIDATRFGIS